MTMKGDRADRRNAPGFQDARDREAWRDGAEEDSAFRPAGGTRSDVRRDP